MADHGVALYAATLLAVTGTATLASLLPVPGVEEAGRTAAVSRRLVLGAARAVAAVAFAGSALLIADAVFDL